MKKTCAVPECLAAPAEGQVLCALHLVARTARALGVSGATCKRCGRQLKPDDWVMLATKPHRVHFACEPKPPRRQWDNDTLFDDTTNDARQGWNETPEFDGETYEHDRDHGRLAAQLGRVMAVMRDYQWHTLGDIEAKTGDEKQSISARLRDFRKEKFGGHHIARRYILNGLFEYRLSPPPEAAVLIVGPSDVKKIPA